jgi:hypothetical protein
MGDPRGALAAWEKLLAINPEARSMEGKSVKDLVEALRQTIP